MFFIPYNVYALYYRILKKCYPHSIAGAIVSAVKVTLIVTFTTPN